MCSGGMRKSWLAFPAAPRTTPWGTHAYIISAVMAEQLANLGKWMIHRAALVNEDKSAWELDGDDIKIDHFIKNYYDQLLPAEHRQRYITRDSFICGLHEAYACLWPSPACGYGSTSPSGALCSYRWMIFGTPKAIPWSFGSVVSSASNGCRCECEDIDDCIMAGRAPIAPSTGLASQHNCGNRIGHLKKWHKVRRISDVFRVRESVMVQIRTESMDKGRTVKPFSGRQRWSRQASVLLLSHRCRVQGGQLKQA